MVTKFHKYMPWYIGDKASSIDEQVKCLSLPNCISRLPRSIVGDLNNWKASEYRTFLLLFYSVPILWRSLPDKYFQHYLLFVHAIYLLPQEPISASDLSKACGFQNHLQTLVFICTFINLYVPFCSRNESEN